jgi:hypothetical protein
MWDHASFSKRDLEALSLYSVATQFDKFDILAVFGAIFKISHTSAIDLDFSPKISYNKANL